jgi:hypothetical protein
MCIAPLPEVLRLMGVEEMEKMDRQAGKQTGRVASGC